MGSTRCRGVEGVVDACGVGRTHQCIDLISVDPSDRGRFVGSPRMAGLDRTAIHERHDGRAPALVSARRPVRRCRQPGASLEVSGVIFERTKQNARAITSSGGLLDISLTMSYFHTGTRTIIGAEAFHFPVRDGKEWDHLAMVIRLNRLPSCLSRKTANSQSRLAVFPQPRIRFLIAHRIQLKAAQHLYPI